MKYNLSSSKSDQKNFNQMIYTSTVEMCKSAGTDAYSCTPQEYAEVVWDNTVLDIEYGNIEVDDITQAKAITLKAATEAIQDYQA